MSKRTCWQIVVAVAGLVVILIMLTVRAGKAAGWTEYPGERTLTFTPADMNAYYGDLIPLRINTAPVEYNDKVEKVEHEGSATCAHDWVMQAIKRNSTTMCAVYHGSPCGCPDGWPRTGLICRKCLRKEITVRTCTEIPQAPPPKTEYEAAAGLWSTIRQALLDFRKSHDT